MVKATIKGKREPMELEGDKKEFVRFFFSGDWTKVEGED